MKKSLLIIGGGYEQIRAYQLAKEMGLFVVGTDVNPYAPAFDFADDKLICSTRDAKQTLTKVLKYSKTHQISGVITIANDVPYTVALVAQSLKLKGISLQAAKFTSNKLLMKNKFKKFGIPTPSFVALKEKNEFFKKIKEMRFPLVLKPSDGRGARGVLYLDETADLSWAWEHSLENSENKILLLEEYVIGDQLSVEGIFLHGKYHAIAFADRNYANLNSTKPHIIEDGGVIPSKYEGEMLDKISNMIENASISIGIKWGTVKADIVLSKDGPMVIEIAARLSGNYLATHHIPMAYGIDIVSLMIKLSLGLDIEESLLIPKHKRYLGVRYFFPKPGFVKAIHGVDKVKSYSYVKMLDIYRKVGDIQPIIDNHGKRAGTVICEALDYSTAIERVENAVREIIFDIDHIN